MVLWYGLGGVILCGALTSVVALALDLMNLLLLWPSTRGGSTALVALALVALLFPSRSGGTRFSLRFAFDSDVDSTCGLDLELQFIH